MKLEKLRIIVDEREKKSGIPDLLKAVGVNIEMKMLPLGDYIVAPETVVERKTINDLVSSIFDGRLFDQCTRLKEHFQNPIILMEGNVDEIENITENPLVFYGALSSIAIDFKIPIIPTPDASQTAKRMLAKFGSPLKVFIASSTELAKIEGLGGAKAKKIRNMLESQSQHMKKSNQDFL